MVKLTKILLILILIFILSLAFFRHTLCRFLISNAAAKATGLKLAIEDLNLDVLNSSLDMRGITLYNPPGFKDGILGRAEEIFIKYNLSGLVRGRLHLRRVRAQISEINIIRDEQGRSNVAAFKKERSKAKSAVTATPDIPPVAPSQEKRALSKRKRPPRFLIDRLELSVKEVTFINYKAGTGQPAVIILTGEGPYILTDVSNFKNVIDSVSLKGGFGGLLNNLSGMINMDRFKAATETIRNKIKDILPESR